MERYADALASVDDSRQELTKDLERRTIWNGRPVRGLGLLGDDNRMLMAISRGEFSLNGFRNRDLQPLLWPDGASDPVQAKRQRASADRSWPCGSHCFVRGTIRNRGPTLEGSMKFAKNNNILGDSNTEED